ncbi:MAB_1171c family putative transporter [Streptomyces sp. NPDC001443]
MNIQVVVVAMLWAVTLWRAPSFWHSHKQRSLEAAFATLAAAMTFELPRAADWVDSCVGITSVSYLLKHMLGVVSAAAVLDFVIAIVRPGGYLRRFRRTAEAACLVLMVVAFACAPNGRKTPDDVLIDNEPSGFAVLHVAVFTLYIGVAMTVTALLFAHAARHTTDCWVRTGHALLSAGGALGVLYSAQRVVHLVYVATDEVTVVGVESDARVSILLKMAAITAIVLGSSVSPLSIAAQARRDKRALLHLEPLWTELTSAVPSVVLSLEPGRGRTELLLHRRLVEIGDATLGLRAYVPASLQVRALEMARDAGYTSDQRAAVAEAAWLKTATLIALRAQPFEGDHPRPGGDGMSLTEELKWLCQVGTAFNRCAAVHRFASEEAAKLAP